MIGFFDFTNPTYLIRDPELFKQIAIKSFDSFEDHRFLVNPKIDEMLGNAVFMMPGKKWREMRATLSPAFTGSKMRLMFELMRDCAKNTSKHFCELTQDGDVMSVEMLDIFSRYATDIIATCSFGVDLNSIEDRDNKFLANGQKISEKTTVLKNIKFVVQRFAPKLMELLKIEYFDREIRDFLTDMAMSNMDARRKGGINRPDIMDILMKAKDGTLSYQEDQHQMADGFATVDESSIGRAKVTRKWTDLELVSQCFAFFGAGYDTMASMLVAAANQLALNPDVQQRLIDEIVETEANLNGAPISYEGLQKLKYMDMVVCEVMRIRPPVSFTDRICTKDCELVLDNGRKVKIDKGIQLWIPIYAYHRDPKYFPNPEKFDPERFSDANKGNINMAAYIPFGVGPRNCIGSRFSLVEAKVILYYLLKDFSLETNSQTEIPLKIQSTATGVYPKNGLYLNIRLRH